jgi:hypothetical protein
MVNSQREERGGGFLPPFFLGELWRRRGFGGGEREEEERLWGSFGASLALFFFSFCHASLSLPLGLLKGELLMLSPA